MKAEKVKIVLPPPKLAIVVDGQQEPIAEELVVKYNLKGVKRAPFTGYGIVQIE